MANKQYFNLGLNKPFYGFSQYMCNSVVNKM
jgi:hypothetical protein